MITTNGKQYIKRYMAGFVPSIAQSIAFGIGGKAESQADLKLQFEVGRSDIVLTSYDFVNDRLVYKAPVPDDFAGSIFEVALFSTSQDIVAAEYGSRLITSFDSATEDWVNASTGADSNFSTSAIFGTDSLFHTPASAVTVTDSLKDVTLDLSGYSAADKFVLALRTANANASNIVVQLLTDVSNYYQLTYGAQTTGNKVLELTKGAATTVGTPNWASITELRVATTAGAGGAASVMFDGFRIDDADSNNPDYVMVSREVLSPVFIKEVGKSQEIEFALNISV